MGLVPLHNPRLVQTFLSAKQANPITLMVDEETSGPHWRYVTGDAERKILNIVLDTRGKREERHRRKEDDIEYIKL